MKTLLFLALCLTSLSSFANDHSCKDKVLTLQSYFTRDRDATIKVSKALKEEGLGNLQISEQNIDFQIGKARNTYLDQTKYTSHAHIERLEKVLATAPETPILLVDIGAEYCAQDIAEALYLIADQMGIQDEMAGIQIIKRKQTNPNAIMFLWSPYKTRPEKKF